MCKGLLDNNLLDNRIEEVDIWSIGIITYDNRTTKKTHNWKKNKKINNDKKKFNKLFQIIQTGRRELRQYNKRRATRQ